MNNIDDVLKIKKKTNKSKKSCLFNRFVTYFSKNLKKEKTFIGRPNKRKQLKN